MFNKTNLFRLAALAVVLIFIFLAILMVVPVPTHQTIVPTLMQLSSESPDTGVHVAAAPTESSETLVRPTEEKSELALPPWQPTEIANGILAPASEDATTDTTVIPTAQPFPTLPIVSVSAYNFVPVALPQPQQSVPNQIVITFKSDTSQQARDAYVTSLGGQVKQSIAALNTVIVEVPQQISAPTPLASNIVLATELDYYVSAQVAIPPSDPYYSQQWALSTIGAQEAWQNLPDNAPKVVIAVIDSGVCINNPDLAGRVLSGWDFVENDSQPQDAFGHGCGVAGIIAANDDDGIGIAGVAPNAMILPLRVLNNQGIGTYSDVAAAIVYAADNGAQVINLSLGGTDPSSVLEQAVNYAVGKGLTIVAAAGNTGKEQILYPAAYEQVISVGSVDQDLNISSFSSRGAGVDLLAPGRDILTTWNDGSIRMLSGTSFAAPQVAGIVALESAYGQTLSTDKGIIRFGGSAPGTDEAPTIGAFDLCPASPYTVPASDTASLIFAINCANSTSGSNTINLTNSTYTLTETNNATNGGNGLPVIVNTSTAGPLIINGNGATITRSSVGGTPNFHLFDVETGGDLTLNGLTLSNGKSTYGGGIYNLGTLTITSSTLANNSATGISDGGGAIFSVGALTITNSTVSGNQSTSVGAGIQSKGTFSLLDSTVSGNTAVDDGGGIWVSNTAKLLNSTVSGNTLLEPDSSRGGGIFNTGTLNISFSTIAYNMTAIDVLTTAIADNIYSQSISNIGNSLIVGDNPHNTNSLNGGSISGSIIGANTTIILPLGMNGGTTATYALTDSSIARDYTNCNDVFGASVTTDQRGSIRPVGSSCDAGSYEATCPGMPVSILTSTDLIQAIDAANCDIADNTLNLQAGTTYTLTTVNNTVDGFNGLPQIRPASTQGKLTINGNGAIIERSSAGGTPDFRLFDVESGADLTLNNVTIRNGRWQVAGAINILTDANVTINHSTLSGNTAIGEASNYTNADGGAIFNRGTLIVTNSSIRDNTSAGEILNPNNGLGDMGSGAGIFNLIHATLTVTNSTFTGNTANNFGGGISNSGTMTVANSTFSGNTAVNGGSEIFDTLNTGVINNTILANGSGPNECYGASAVSHSLIEDGSCGVTNGVNGNFTGDPLLSTLTGSPAYFPLPLGSPALNTGDNSLALDANNSPLTTDQRGTGFPRIAGDTVDIGAYEAPAPSITTQPQSQAVNYGLTVGLSVIAVGDAPLSYQWYQGTMPDTSSPVGTNSPNFTTPPQTTTTPYWVRISNSFGHSDSNTAVITVNINLLTNGNFSAGMSGWQTFGNITSRVNNGVFEFYHNTTLGSIRPSILQAVSTSFSAGAALEFTMELGNSSALRKRALVFIVNNNWTDLQTCSFWLEPNSPLRTYILQGRPTVNWPSAQVAIYANPADNTGWLQVDNANLHQLPGTAPAQTLCIDSTAPAPGSGTDGSNLIVNGGFSAGMSNWLTYGNITSRLNNGLFEFYHNTTLGTVRPSVLQNTNAALPANAPVELQLQLGNSGAVRKRALVILFQYDWTDLQMCSFWIPPNTALGTYIMQTSLPKAWSNVSVSIYANPADNTGWLQLDNVSLQSRPSLTVEGTSCYEPGAGAASLALAEVQPDETPTVTETPDMVTMTEEATEAVTEVVDTPTATSTEESTEIVTEVATETVTEVVDVPVATDTPSAEPTGTVLPSETPIDLPTAFPFPTLPPPASPTEAPTALPFPTLPPPASPTLLPTSVPLSLPVVATFDDGASDWLHSQNWQLGSHESGLAWWMVSNTDETLRWQQQIDLRGLQANVILTFQSQFVGDGVAMVQVSTDGITWQTAAIVPSSETWTTVSVDLSGYSGNIIQIEFTSQETNAATNDQWVLDNILMDTLKPTEVVSPETTVPTATETQISVEPEVTEVPPDESPLPTSDVSSS